MDAEILRFTQDDKCYLQTSGKDAAFLLFLSHYAITKVISEEIAIEKRGML